MRSYETRCLCLRGEMRHFVPKRTREKNTYARARSFHGRSFVDRLHTFARFGARYVRNIFAVLEISVSPVFVAVQRRKVTLSSAYIMRT